MGAVTWERFSLEEDLKEYLGVAIVWILFSNFTVVARIKHTRWQQCCRREFLEWLGQLHPTLLRQQGVNPTGSQTHGGSDGVRCKESDSLNRGEPSISEPRQDCGDVVGWLRNGQIGSGGDRWWATGKEQKARCTSTVGNADSSGEVDTGRKYLENSQAYDCGTVLTSHQHSGQI